MKRIKYTLLIIALVVAMVLSVGACAAPEVSGIPEDLDLSGISFPAAEYIYDGEEHSLAVRGTLPKGVTVLYEGNAQTQVGSHTVTAKFYYEDEYIKGKDVKSTLTIKPLSSIDLSGVILASKTVEYSGAAQSTAIQGNLPEGVTVEYLNNSQTNAGVHSVSAKFYYKGNYLEGKDKTATITINKRDLSEEMYGVALNSTTVIFSGDAYSIYISGNLPDGVSVSYEGNGVSEVGTHTVVAHFAVDTENYMPLADKTATINILAAQASGVVIPSDLDLSGITLTGDTVTYDGKEHSLEISGSLPTDVTVLYLNNGKVNAGEHTVTAQFYYKGLHVEGKDLTAALKINKKTITLSGISFNNTTVIYDGKAHSISIEGTLPAGVSVSYEGNGKTAVGSYNVTASFAVDNPNYQLTATEYTANLVIEERNTGIEIPSDLDLSGITLAGDTVTYDGKEHSLEISGSIPTDVTVLYLNNGKVNAGEHTVTAQFYYKGLHIEGKDLTAALKINKKTITLSGISFNNTTVIYDGKAHSISIEGTLPAGVSVSYEGNGKVEVGEYTVVARFVVDSDNCELITDTYTAVMTISESVKMSFESYETIYDGTPKRIGVDGLAGMSSSITFLGYVDQNGGEPVSSYSKVDAGVYNVTARFAVSGVYDPALDMTATLTIKKAQIKVSASATQVEYIFDGNKKSADDILVWDGEKPECITIVASAAQRLPGTYTLVYKFVADEAVAKNYETKELSITMTIVDNPNLATEGLQYGLMSDGTYYVSGYIGDDTAVIIPSTYENKPVSAIKQLAFANNKKLEYVKIPDSIVAIGQSAFRGCTALDTITLPFIGGSHNSSNEYFGYIFGASGIGGNEQFVPESLKTVDISSACERIPAYAFQYCRSIVEVRIGSGVTELGISAFRGCTALREVYIPESVTVVRPVAIVNSAFYECSSELTVYLQAAEIPESYTEAWRAIDAEGNKVKVVLSTTR